VNAAIVPAHFRNQASSRCVERHPFTTCIESDYFREVKENDPIVKRVKNKYRRKRLPENRLLAQANPVRWRAREVAPPRLPTYS